MPAANAWLKNHPWFYNVRILIHDIAKLPCGEGWQVAVRGNKIGWKCFSFHRRKGLMSDIDPVPSTGSNRTHGVVDRIADGIVRRQGLKRLS
jgi:hypothetical protein